MSQIALKEVHRVMTICNACRYCEGFCAVWPAMELRRTFTEADLKYLANLCHNCRGCYYACQYAPPHEFKLNAPQALGALRLETYKEFARPQWLAWLFERNGLAVFLITLLSTLGMIWASLETHGSANFFAAHVGPESFYAILPYWLMLVLFSGVGLLVLLSMWQGMLAFWQATNGKPGGLFDGASMGTAIWHCLTLRYLEGGGGGCNYPDDRFSMIRRNFHHAVFYGFLLCLVSTTAAFIDDHILGLPAPYPLLSLPVVLGTLGGLGLLIGTGGMLWLKTVMDRKPAVEDAFGMDRAFSILLFLVSLSGLLLLALRETRAMGLLLCVHLGLVLGLFLTLPFGKFIHAVYRYSALVRNAAEQKAGSSHL